MPLPYIQRPTRLPRRPGPAFRCTLRCGDTVATLGDRKALTGILIRACARIIRRPALTKARDPS